jgi:hypothetical protein
MESRIKITTHENKDRDQLDIPGRWVDWSILGHSDGDVSIEVDENGSSNHLFLNQTELKQVIEFLQSKVK